MMRAELKVDVRAIADKLESAIDDDVRLYAHQQYADIISPWVPMDQGVLMDHWFATPDELTYIGPYAHYQWAGVSKRGKPLNYRHDHHPLATSHWEEAAMRTKMDSFVAEIAAYIRKKGRNG